MTGTKDELKHKLNRGIIGTGSMSDPYNPFEKEYELTGDALKIYYGVTMRVGNGEYKKEVN